MRIGFPTEPVAPPVAALQAAGRFAHGSQAGGLGLGITALQALIWNGLTWMVHRSILIRRRAHCTVGLLALWALAASAQAARFEVARGNPQAIDTGPGTVKRPWRTISKAAASVGPGDVVVIRAGVYRERVVVKTDGTAAQPIRFEAAPGEWVVLTGADRLTGWKKAPGEDPVYTVAWPHRFNTYAKTMTHPGDDYHRVIGRCEQVFVNGGDKLVLCRGAVLEHSRFIRNRGNGIWFDIGNEQCEVRQCLIADNEDAGIFYEISYGLRAHDNVIVGNGFAPTSGAWGAQAGISLSSSPDCVIERNLLVGNREGFNLREQFRTTPTLDNRQERAVWNHDEIIRHNIIAYNRDAQIWGWFDVNDHRHWPAKDATPAAAAVPPATEPGDLAADYGAKDDRGQPVGLTLEKLNIRFENNAYFANLAQGVFKWGTLWGKHQEYGTVAEFQAALSIDHGGSLVEPPFADVDARDFRLRPDAPPLLRENQPQGWKELE